MMMTTTQKRKAVDQVNHDFSDFSLSSPATKIRRLDLVELAPIMEEDEVLVQEEESESMAAATAVEEVENEERAIVLFNPNNTLIDSSPTFSLTPHFLYRLKAGQSGLWSNHSNLFNNASSHVQEKDNNGDDISNKCLAVVPWVDSHLSPPPPPPPPQDAGETMMMEAQQEIASMDIEQEFINGYGAGQQRPAAELHQWQQQHCMFPSQLPPYNAAPPPAPVPAPVVWFH